VGPTARQREAVVHGRVSRLSARRGAPSVRSAPSCHILLAGGGGVGVGGRGRVSPQNAGDAGRVTPPCHPRTSRRVGPETWCRCRGPAASPGWPTSRIFRFPAVFCRSRRPAASPPHSGCFRHGGGAATVRRVARRAATVSVFRASYPPFLPRARHRCRDVHHLRLGRHAAVVVVAGTKRSAPRLPRHPARRSHLAAQHPGGRGDEPAGPRAAVRAGRHHHQRRNGLGGVVVQEVHPPRAALPGPRQDPVRPFHL